MTEKRVADTGAFCERRGVRPDLYLKIVGEGAKMLRGEIPFSRTIPFEKQRYSSRLCVPLVSVLFRETLVPVS